MEPHQELHDITKPETSDKRHETPNDNSSKLCWIFEDSCNPGSVLTEDGVTQIVEHKYKPGHYTTLDNFFNPYWVQLTELLPMWLAPNLVTLLGFGCCLLSYLTTWYYLPNFTSDTEIPDWLCVLNGSMYILYYTLDCMDGKQARRTNSSTPLGQLFDHGVDTVCGLSHLSGVHAYVQGGGSWCYLYTHLALQCCFFIAQWEEYYTGVLPHAVGDVGVTEVNLTTALLSILNAFVNRQKFYNQSLQETLWLSNDLVDSYFPTFLVSVLRDYPMKVIIACFWCGFASYLIVNTIKTTTTYVASKNTHNTPIIYVVSAVSKLFVPLSLVATTVLLESTLPHDVKQLVFYNHIRYWSLAVGLTFALLTNKIIVFSMAKMAYASIQLDAILIIAVQCWLCWEFRDYSSSEENNEPTGRLTPEGLLWIWRLIVVVVLVRFLSWTKIAIGQIATRLDIHVFTIKPPKKES